MALFQANQAFSVVVGGVDKEISQGEFYDSTSAVYLAAPTMFSLVPDGVTGHQIAAAGDVVPAADVVP